MDTGQAQKGNAMPQLRRIRASAGAGKTYELTSRFVALLATARNREEAGEACALPRLPRDGYAWQEILAITFTNRAADEMRSRIIERLKSIALGLRASHAQEDAPLTPDLAARWLDVLLRRFNALQVRTIDSLLHQIVRMAALELDLPPDFTPAFDNSEALAPWLDTLLETAREEGDARDHLTGACQHLLFHRKDFRGFTAGELIRKETLKLAMLLCDPDMPQLASTGELSARLERLTAAVRNGAARLKNIIEDENLQANAKLINALAGHAKLRPKDKLPSCTMLVKDSLDACLNKGSKGRASKEAERAYAALRENVLRLGSEGVLLNAGLRLSPFLDLANILAKSVPEFLRQEGRVPQDMMPELAKRALAGPGGVPAAFCRMGATLTHILIDEFQDTSRKQWATIHPLALEALSRGGSLIWVGDVKQAIYGWRGGDALLFDEISEDPALRAVVPAPHTDTLLTNHRSRSAIVRHNNAVFAQLAKPDTAASILRLLLPDSVSESRFQTEQSLLARAFTDAAQLECGKDGGYVRLSFIEGENKDDLNETTRDRLLALLHEIETRRPFGDVAVLVRSNTQAALAAQWLMEADIPVVTENSFLLADHPLIRELVALLGFINAPEDDAAFWPLLSGEMLAKTAAAPSRDKLNDWLCGQSNRSMPLWRCFRRDFPDMWNAFFAPFHHESGLIGAYDAVSEALERHELLRGFPNDAPFLRRFLEVLHLAEEDGRGSVSAFLEYWGEHSDEEKAPMPESLDAVRVMTIHKAKGLQFPVVIVPWHNLTPKPDKESPVVAATQDGLRLLTYPTPAMGDDYDTMLGAAAREALHLLYVAWTRPEEELYAFLGSTPHSAQSSEALKILLAGVPEERGTPSGGVKQPAAAGKKISPTAPDTASGTAPVPDTDRTALPPQRSAAPPVTTADTENEETKPEANAFSASKETAPAWRPMDWLPELKIFRNPLGSLRDTAVMRGTLVHRCLEELRLTGDAKADARKAVERGLAGLPLTAEGSVFSTENLIDTLAWYAALPETGNWLRHGTPEQSLIDADGSVCRADLLVDDGKSVTIVDYKTGGHSAAHAGQVQRYMAIAAAAQPLPVRGVLVYLDLKECIPVH